MNLNLQISARFLAALGLLGISVLMTGCGTLSNGRGWGQDAIYPVQWERVKQAAKNAVTDPMTWVTAGGAAVFAIDDWDNEVTEWAADKTPVFGSTERAEDASDFFLNILRSEAYTTILFTPSGDDPVDWAFSKLRGLGVEYAAIKATAGATDITKSTADRMRPDGSDTRSFVSGHASFASSAMRLANRNLDSIDIPGWARTTIKTGNYLALGATSWARVEARQHHPSDVLAGACLGNIVTIFIHDAFMNLPEDSSFSFYVEPSPNGLFGMVSWTF